MNSLEITGIKIVRELLETYGEELCTDISMYHNIVGTECILKRLEEIIGDDKFC